MPITPLDFRTVPCPTYPEIRLAIPGYSHLVERLAARPEIASSKAGLDLARLPVPVAIHGRSWKPLLEEKHTDWRDSFFYCYFYEKNFGSPLTTAVRTTDAKLIKYPGHDEWTEVFDLKADPYEIKNLAADPAQADRLGRLAAGLNVPEAENVNLSINLVLTDSGEQYVLWLENSVLHFKAAAPEADANATLALTSQILVKMIAGVAGVKDTIFSDDLTVTGSKIDLVRFFGLIDKAPATFSIVTRAE